MPFPKRTPHFDRPPSNPPKPCAPRSPNSNRCREPPLPLPSVAIQRVPHCGKNFSTLRKTPPSRPVRTPPPAVGPLCRPPLHGWRDPAGDSIPAHIRSRVRLTPAPCPTMLHSKLVILHWRQMSIIVYLLRACFSFHIPILIHSR